VAALCTFGDLLLNTAARLRLPPASQHFLDPVTHLGARVLRHG
jgi:hypothetical protein